MIYLKYFELTLIILTCTSIGFIKSGKLKCRVEELNNIEFGLNLFRTKIQYTNETIFEIFKQISLVVYNSRNNIFKNTIVSKNILISESWNNAIINENMIEEEDKQILQIFGKNLGKLDKKGQISQIDETLEIIKKQIKNAEKIYEKNSKLYKSLGGICGAILAIILL